MRKFFLVLLCMTVFSLTACDEIVYDDNIENVYSDSEKGSAASDENDTPYVQNLPEEIKTSPNNTENPPSQEASQAVSVTEQNASVLELDRTKNGFGYSPNSENKQVSIGSKYEDMITKYGGFFIDRANTPNIYLTMDEGYEN